MTREQALSLALTCALLGYGCEDVVTAIDEDTGVPADAGAGIDGGGSDGGGNADGGGGSDGGGADGGGSDGGGPDSPLNDNFTGWDPDAPHRDEDGELILHPIGYADWPGHGATAISEWLTERMNHLRARSGYDPYLRHVDQELCVAEEAVAATEMGVPHVLLCGANAQGSCGGTDGPLAIWYCINLFWQEGPRGGHYRPMMSPHPRQVAAASYVQFEPRAGKGVVDYFNYTLPTAPANTLSPGTQEWVAVDVAAGGNHTCALIDDGSVRCWGANHWAQLGDGHVPVTTEVGVGVGTPSSPVPLSERAVAIAAGYLHTCAVLESGGVECWGGDYQDQLGNGGGSRWQDAWAVEKRASPTPVAVSGLPGRAVGIEASHSTTCVEIEGGTIRCWGPDMFRNYRSVQGMTATFSPGNEHGCLILPDGRAQCLGADTTGQLGDGEFWQDRTEDDWRLAVRAVDPVDVVDLGSVREIAAGGSHTCAIGTDDSVWCWGSGTLGQLGEFEPPRNDSPTPRQIPIPAGTTLASLDAGGVFTCGITEAQTVLCWGSNDYGKLGGGPDAVRGAVTQVAGLTNVSHISTSQSHVCAVHGAGRVSCWGYDGFGQLGDGGENAHRSTPAPVQGF